MGTHEGPEAQKNKTQRLENPYGKLEVAYMHVISEDLTRYAYTIGTPNYYFILIPIPDDDLNGEASKYLADIICKALNTYFESQSCE